MSESHDGLTDPVPGEQLDPDASNSCACSGSSSRSHVRRLKCVLGVILSLSGIWGSCAIAIILALWMGVWWVSAVSLPASLCVLSLCWHPKLQVYVVRSSDERFHGHWKAMFLYTLLKTLAMLVGLNLVLLLRLGDLGFLDSSFFSAVWEGLLRCGEPGTLYPLVSLFGGSFMVHTVAYIGAALCLARSCLTLPSVFSTPLATAAIIFFCIPTSPTTIPTVCVSMETAVWVIWALAVTIWLAPYLVYGKNLNRNSKALLKSFDDLFLQPSWNSVFLEQHLFLSYRAAEVKSESLGYVADSRHTATHTGIGSDSKVFICTTMYREADFEMRRLLKSLSKISKSKRLRSVYMEAHIFLDNGVKDLDVTEFAKQLLSLLKDTAGVEHPDLAAYTTPYGVQFSGRLPAGLPLFIHLKDATKFKPKKRWSQVMYISYILNQRARIEKTRFHDTPGEDIVCPKHASRLHEEECRDVPCHCSRSLRRASIIYPSDWSMATTNFSCITETTNVTLSSLETSSVSSCNTESIDTAEFEASANDPGHSYGDMPFLTIPASKIGQGHVWLNKGHTNHAFELCTPAENLDHPVPEKPGEAITESPTPSGESPTSSEESPTSSELERLLKGGHELGENTYILATDADMKFSADSVVDLLTLCNHDHRIGGACGRTHPIGKKTGPVVSYQKFEYAKGQL